MSRVGQDDSVSIVGQDRGVSIVGLDLSRIGRASWPTVYGPGGFVYSGHSINARNTK